VSKLVPKLAQSKRWEGGGVTGRCRGRCWKKRRARVRRNGPERGVVVSCNLPGKNIGGHGAFPIEESLAWEGPPLRIAQKEVRVNPTKTGER